MTKQLTYIKVFNFVRQKTKITLKTILTPFFKQPLKTSNQTVQPSQIENYRNL